MNLVVDAVHNDKELVCKYSFKIGFNEKNWIFTLYLYIKHELMFDIEIVSKYSTFISKLKYRFGLDFQFDVEALFQGQIRSYKPGLAQAYKSQPLSENRLLIGKK